MNGAMGLFVICLLTLLAVLMLLGDSKPMSSVCPRLYFILLVEPKFYMHLMHFSRRLDISEFMGKMFQAAQLTHERFLTIDHHRSGVIYGQKSLMC